MGKLAKPQRSKKHKKIKSVDPFYHGSRKDVRQAGWNQKPKGYDQEIPRKLRQLGFTIDGVKSGKVGKKSKNKFVKHADGPQKYDNQFNTPLGAKPGTKLITPAKVEKTTPEKSMTNHKSEMKQGKKAKKDSKVSQEVLNDYIDNLKPTRQFVEPFNFKQKPDESEAAFMRRVNKETERVLVKSRIDDKFDVSDEQKMKMKIKAKKGMSEKKKQRLKDKKQKKLEGIKQKKQEKLLDFDALQDKVEFGDVAHAPPVLSVRPKKAHTTDVDRPGLRMPELKAAIAQNMSEHSDVRKSLSKGSDAPKAIVERQVGKTVKRKALSVHQQRMADAQRDSFIDAYRQMKKSKHK